MRVARRVALAFGLSFLSIGVAPVLAETKPAAYEQAPLLVVVDGVKHDVVVVMLQKSDVLIPLEAFVALQIKVKPDVQQSGGTRYVSLAALAPRVRYSIDETTLELRLTVDPALLPYTALSVATNQQVSKASAVPSGFLTYSLASDPFNVKSGSSGFLQSGFGGSSGLFLASVTATDTGFERGLFSYQTESQDRLSQTTFGDQVAGTDLLGGTGIVGGIGFSRHWEFQPNFNFSPKPGLSGTVLEPTSADIYVNGVYDRTVQLQPGQFDLGSVGAGNANVTQIVLRDAQGNTRTITGSSYATQGLLAKGLTDYDYTLGFLRPNAFGTDDRYGPLAAVASYRLGLTNALTLGGHFESTRGVVAAGPQVALALPFGSVSFEALSSDSSGLHGLAAGAGLQGHLGRATFDFTAETRSADYSTIGLTPVGARTRSAVSAEVSIPVFARSYLSLSQQTTSYSNEPAAQQTLLQLTRSASRFVNLTFRAERDRGGSVFGFAGAGSSLGSRWSGGVTADIKLHGRGTATVSADSSAGATVAVSQPGPDGLGLGYTLTGGSDGSLGGQALYRSQHGDVNLALNRDGGSTSTDITLSGSIAAFRGGVVFGEPIYGGYAFADVSGYSHVAVYNGSSFAGVTDGRGLALVTGLEAYERSTITVGDLGAKSDLIVDQPSAVVDPKTYSGVIAELRVHEVRAYFGYVVVRRSGAADVVPQFARLTLTGRGHDYSVDLGSEGQFYLENLVPGRYDATVLGADFTCTFPLVILTSDGPMTKLGTLICGVSQ